MKNKKFLAKLFILLFILSYLTLGIRLVFDGFVTDHAMVKRVLGIPADPENRLLFSNAIYSMLGALIGCGIYDIVSFHKYVAVIKKFESEHIWGYYFAPWMSACLGLIIYGLLKTGLLVFTGSVTNDNLDTARLGYLTIGFLAGFGWFKLIQKIKKIIDELFGSLDNGGKDNSVTDALRNSASVVGEGLKNSELPDTGAGNAGTAITGNEAPKEG